MDFQQRFQSIYWRNRELFIKAKANVTSTSSTGWCRGYLLRKRGSIDWKIWKTWGELDLIISCMECINFLIASFASASRAAVMAKWLEMPAFNHLVSYHFEALAALIWATCSLLVRLPSSVCRWTGGFLHPQCLLGAYEILYVLDASYTLWSFPPFMVHQADSCHLHGNFVPSTIFYKELWKKKKTFFLSEIYKFIGIWSLTVLIYQNKSPKKTRRSFGSWRSAYSSLVSLKMWVHMYIC